jgi:hypothetical protein
MKILDENDIEVIMHSEGSAAFKERGAPVVETVFPGGVAARLTVEAAQRIGRAAEQLEPQTKEHKPIPVAGYKPQNQDKIDLANEGKQLEERVLRYIEKVEYRLKGHMDGPGQESIRDGDARFAAIGRTQIQLGFMMVIRAIFNPERIKLPEDGRIEIELIEADRPD